MLMVPLETKRPKTPTLLDRVPWLTLAVAGVCLALHVLAGPASAALAFDRAAILDGEWYRLLTGHLVHGDGARLWLNLGALVLVGGFYESGGRRLRRARLAWLLGISALAISAALLVFAPAAQTTLGLSALLVAVFTAVVLRGWLRRRNPLWLALAVGAAASIVLIDMTGASWLLALACLAGAADVAVEDWWSRCVRFARGVDLRAE